jgi:hypothetical protein
VRASVAVLVAAALVAASTRARAEPQPQPEPQPKTQQTQQQEPSPKRAVPSYDGRAPKPMSPEEIALWPLRVLLSPLYFTSEYIIRRPLGAITRAAERAKVPEKLYDFFAFGPDHKIGFAPVGFVEFGFNPSVGIYGFWDDALVKHNFIRLHYEVWPDDWLAGVISDRYEINESNTLRFRTAAFKRPDMVFYGFGPKSAAFNISRYTEASFDTSAGLTSYLWRRTRIEGYVGLRKVDIGPGEYGSDPSLEKEAGTGVFPIPFGFNRGYLAPYARVYASFDTRRRHTTQGSGIRIEAQSESGGDVEHSPASGWIRWGGAATVYVDLNEHSRVLSLSAATSFADPIGDNPVPFTELVTLGGDQWLHGFFPGRFVDRSSAVAQVEYRWPVAPWLDGTLQTAVGNVFGEHLRGFDAKLLRLSAGFGLTTTSELPVQMLAAFGTDTFDRGATVNEFRLTFGVPRSF